jgi:DNA-3-methyladenine glycosylase II
MVLDKDLVRQGLEKLAARDADLSRAIAQVGFPDFRRRPQTFASLLRIVAGQQLSAKAAATIFARVAEATNGARHPDDLLCLSDEQLCGLGLSRRKAEYCRGLAEALQCGRLKLAALRHQSDEQVIAAITALKGFGRWSAQMYLIFALGRPDVWPRDDLGVQTGLARIKGLNERPRGELFEQLGEPWRAYRSTVALLCWRYLANAPMEQRDFRRRESCA